MIFVTPTLLPLPKDRYSPNSACFVATIMIAMVRLYDSDSWCYVKDRSSAVAIPNVANQPVSFLIK